MGRPLPPRIYQKSKPIKQNNMTHAEILSAQNATEFTVTVTRMIPHKIISNEKFLTARAALETFLDHVEAHEYEYSVNADGMEAGGIGHDYRIELTAE